MGNEADFLPASNLVVRNQTDPNHQKQSVYNIFVISQRKHEGWRWLLPADKCLSFFEIDTIILVVCGQACSNYLKH